ncbi:proline-rich receptor-like protein kinase PERK2 [Fagus crenata]
MEKLNIVTLTLFAAFIVLVPKLECQIQPTPTNSYLPPLYLPPLCASQISLANYACSRLPPFIPAPPIVPPSSPDVPPPPSPNVPPPPSPNAPPPSPNVPPPPSPDVPPPNPFLPPFAPFLPPFTPASPNSPNSPNQPPFHPFLPPFFPFLPPLPFTPASPNSPDSPNQPPFPPAYLVSPILPPYPPNDDEGDEHHHRHEHGHGHRHRHRHGHEHRQSAVSDGGMTPEEENCCRWVQQVVDNQCVCQMLLHLPSYAGFLLRPVHEFSLDIGPPGICKITYTCEGTIRKV